jgi:hypothetical protein
VEQEIIGRDGADERRSAERLFHRDLPGGGYVAIELAGAGAESGRVVRVIVERRSDRGRRMGHRPPIILEEEWMAERGFGELYRMACDNVAIARGLLHLPRAD